MAASAPCRNLVARTTFWPFTNVIQALPDAPYRQRRRSTRHRWHHARRLQRSFLCRLAAQGQFDFQTRASGRSRHQHEYRRRRQHCVVGSSRRSMVSGRSQRYFHRCNGSHALLIWRCACATDGDNRKNKRVPHIRERFSLLSLRQCMQFAPPALTFSKNHGPKLPPARVEAEGNMGAPREKDGSGRRSDGRSAARIAEDDRRRPSAASMRASIIIG